MISKGQVDFMANTTAKDLTVGSPMKLIIRFLIPLLFGMLFQQFYNMVDTMIIGRTAERS